jgi:hypothetical protein
MSEIQQLLQMLHVDEEYIHLESVEIGLRQRRGSFLDNIMDVVPQKTVCEAAENGLSIEDYIQCCWNAVIDPYDEKTWKANRETRPSFKERVTGKVKRVFSTIGRHFTGLVFWGVTVSISLGVGYAAISTWLPDPTNTMPEIILCGAAVIVITWLTAAFLMWAALEVLDAW